MPWGYKAEQAQRAYHLMEKGMHTTVKADGDTCYDKGKKEMCAKKKNRSLEL